MNNNSSFSHDSNSQFALSYELLHLLQWLSKNNADKLKKIISKAMEQGLHEEMRKCDNISDLNVQDMHHSMIDFFELLDDLLLESINEQVEKKAREKNLMPTIDHIDSTLCDIETMRMSIEKTTKKLDNFPNINPKEQLCKELLKKWKPVNKGNMH
jgi:hypothetical protein